MSEIGLNINVDSYNNEGIKTIKGNNNAEIYKLYILKNKRRLSLVGKTVKLGYVMAGTTNGDVIENLNITNAEQGEITFPITNRISKQDGIYSCQLAIYGADGFLEHTATFGLTVEANIFTKIAGEIENSKDLTYIERILEEAKTVSGELKTNIPVATNINSSLESNISSASNINTTLADTTEKSKVAATDAIEKKSQLEKSITKAKEFIDGLDGSQNIPGIRMELTELQNGLKSNQSLAYTGSSISANDTLEGRTEGMRIKGRTLVNLLKTTFPTSNFGFTETKQACTINDGKMNRLKPNTKYTFICLDFSDKIHEVYIGDTTTLTLVEWTTIKNKIVFTTPSNIDVNKDLILFFRVNYSTQNTLTIEDVKNMKCMIIEEEQALISYFKGIKSFGEAEQEGDKYKISILSNNENYFKLTNDNIFGIGTTVTVNGNSFTTTTTNGWNQGFGIQVDRIPSGKYKTVFEVIENKDKGVLYEIEYFKDNNSIKTMPLNYVQYEGIINVENIDYDYFKLKFKNGREQSPIGYKYLMLVPYDSNINTYVEKKSDKKDILIKEPLREGDYLYEDNEQVKVDRESGQYTITSNERITKENTLINITRFYIDTQCKNKVNTRNIICNNFNSNGTWWDRDEIGMYWDTSIQGRLWFHIPKTKFNDVESFRNFLKANPTTIVYQLATPVTEVVENCVDIDLDTFQDKTYFSIENSLPGTLDFKVPSNIASVVQNTAKEVNNIWDVINNLLVPSLIDINKNVALATIKNNLK